MDGVYPAPCLFMYTDELIHCQPVIISTGESAGNTSCIDFYNDNLMHLRPTHILQ